MATNDLPTIDLLRQLLFCDFETGQLTWLERPQSFFSDLRQFRSWNTKWGGKAAFITVGRDGYLRGRVLCKNLLTHRVVWAMYSGQWPAASIDHINGNRTDNRICNLREISMKANSRNASLRKDNKVGRVGVYIHRDKFRASIKVDAGSLHLGIFSTLEEAIQAREAAEQLYGFDEGHGKESRGYWRR